MSQARVKIVGRIRSGGTKETGKIVQVQEKVLEKVQADEELDMFWWRKCSDVSQLRCRKYDGAGDEITVADCSSSQTGNSADRHTSEKDCV